MSTSHFLRIFRSIIVLSIVIFLSSCGGGGSGGGSASSESTSFSISGTVSGAVSSGVTMTLSGTSSGTVTTDSSGNYTFTGLADGSYTVTPSLKGYTFNSVSEAVKVNGANITSINFTATTSSSSTYSISGTVTSGGSALPDVVMTLSGSGSGTVATDASGNYTFTGLANGSYTITPSLTGYTFTPASTAVTINGANATTKNFTTTASSAPTYSISGTVTLNGVALNGVTMALKGTNTTANTIDSSGNYTFTGLANGSYTVSPSLAGYTFTPASQAVTINGANATAKNFTAVTTSTRGTFTALAGTMDTARDGHTATLLPNGEILVAGGAANDNSTVSLASAELYDPATDTWSATGSMAEARAWHTAILLSNGKVLVAGGINNDDDLYSAELYDPATGTWSATGSLITGRNGAADMVLLPNSKILIAGGHGGDGPSTRSPRLNSTTPQLGYGLLLAP